jgi:hypothetical protein
MNRVAANLPARRSSSSEEFTIEPDGLQTFIDDVGTCGQQRRRRARDHKRVAKRLSELLAGGVARIDTTARTQNGHIRNDTRDC